MSWRIACKNAFTCAHKLRTRCDVSKTEIYLSQRETRISRCDVDVAKKRERVNEKNLFRRNKKGNFGM